MMMLIYRITNGLQNVYGSIKDMNYRVDNIVTQKRVN